ncbi:MAG: hypothetical protein E7391_02740 [Ruminococcaceae bacterium]|nr:hypothetical protein [Oscillospiraceae bacterium]
MKKLLSSLIIFTLIISSFSCVAFADGEKTWHLPMVDFSSADDIVTSTANTYSGFNSNQGWYARGEYYVYDAQSQNIVVKPAQYSSVNAGFGGNKVLVTDENEKYLVFKAQFCGNNRDAVRAIFYDGTNGWSYMRGAEFFRIGGLNIFTHDTSTTLIAAKDYYKDSWVDVVVVVDMTNDATAYSADIYANGQKATTTLADSFATYVKSESNQMIGVDVRGLWSPRDTAYLDNTGVYTVDKSDLPNLTLSQNNLKFTTSNEVTLANLSKDATLSLVKVNGEYLPLADIKTEKGGLAFNVSEDVLVYGNNTIDLSEVKDIFGQVPTGNATFTVEKPYPQVEVANSTVVAYEDGEGTYTNRFFKLIEEAEDYAKVVFEITADGFTWTVDLDEVYGNVTVNDTVYSKTGVYVATAAIGDVPSDDVEFSVNAYAVDFEGNNIPLN